MGRASGRLQGAAEAREGSKASCGEKELRGCPGAAAKGRSAGREGTGSLGMRPREADVRVASRGGGTRGRAARRGGGERGRRGGVDGAGGGWERRARAAHPGPAGYGRTGEPSCAKGKAASRLLRVDPGSGRPEARAVWEAPSGETRPRYACTVNGEPERLCSLIQRDRLEMFQSLANTVNIITSGRVTDLSEVTA